MHDAPLWLEQAQCPAKGRCQKARATTERAWYWSFVYANNQQKCAQCLLLLFLSVQMSRTLALLQCMLTTNSVWNRQTETETGRTETDRGTGVFV